MTMKTKIFYVCMVAVLMCTQVMNAQDVKVKRGRKHITMEMVAEKQAAKIVNELGFDDKTAAKFTEVYKKYMKELDDVRKEFAPDFKMRGKMEKGKDGAEAKIKVHAPTDEQVDKMMRDRFKQSRKMLDIREKYYDEFRKFLSPKQVQKVYDQGQKNDGMFNREMNRRAGMERKDGRGPAHHGKPVSRDN